VTIFDGKLVTERCRGVDAPKSRLKGATVWLFVHLGATGFPRHNHGTTQRAQAHPSRRNSPTHEEAEFDRVLTTLLFTDIVGSTAQAPIWVTAPGASCSNATTRRSGRCSVATGVARSAQRVTASWRPSKPARAVRCASAITEAVQSLGLEIRAGLHTGEIEVVGEDVRGVAVHIGARVAALAGASEVLVSQTVKDLVAGSGLSFEDAGEHELKGVPDRWHLYRAAKNQSACVTFRVTTQGHSRVLRGIHRYSTGSHKALSCRFVSP
jgi:hypothetical protein